MQTSPSQDRPCVVALVVGAAAAAVEQQHNPHTHTHTHTPCNIDRMHPSQTRTAPRTDYQPRVRRLLCGPAPGPGMIPAADAHSAAGPCQGGFWSEVSARRRPRGAGEGGGGVGAGARYSCLLARIVQDMGKSYPATFPAWVWVLKIRACRRGLERGVSGRR